MNTILTHGVAFTEENSQGYSPAELVALNEELASRLDGVEPLSDEWYATAKAFADEVSRR